MNHEPTVVKPHHSVSEQANTSAPQPINPQTALHQSLTQIQQGAKISEQLPDLKKWTLIFIALIVLVALQAIGMQLIQVSMLGASTPSTGFWGITMIGSWVLAIAAAITILNTRSNKLAKNILVGMGLVIIYSLILDLIQFNIISLVIDGFILWKLFDLHQSVEALGMRSF